MVISGKGDHCAGVLQAFVCPLPVLRLVLRARVVGGRRRGISSRKLDPSLQTGKPEWPLFSSPLSCTALQASD